MSLERKNPIPPGRYWLDVIGLDNVKDFFAWVAEMAGAVVVERVELDGTDLGDPQTVLTRIMSQVFDEENPPKAFVIFSVPAGRSPFLNQAEFGFPNRAPSSIQHADDTVSAPDPTAEAASAVKTIIGVLEGIAAVLTIKTVLDMVKKVRS